MPIGLVIEGNSTSSTLLRLNAIRNELGPVKASALPVARRVSNFLNGGYGVGEYIGLADARIILIRVPDTSVDRVVSELCEADLVWADHAFVLCETWTPTESLAPLKKMGSSIASLVALPEGQRKTFMLEGDIPLVRQMRRVIERGDARGIEVRTGTKHLLFAAMTFCSAIPVPLLLLAHQLLRESGISGNQLPAIVEQVSNEMLSNYLKGARMTWGGPLADLLKSTHGGYWDDLDRTHPEVAKTLRNLVEMSQSRLAPKMSRSHGA